MRAVVAWLGRKTALFAILILAIGFYTLALPAIRDGFAEDVGREALTHDELRATIEAQRDTAQARLEAVAGEARDLPAATLRARIATRRRDLTEARARREAADGFLAAYRPSQILARKRADIDIALIDRELAVLEGALDGRATLEQAEARAAAYARIPTVAAIAASRRLCRARTVDLAAFAGRPQVERELRDLVLDERQRLTARRDRACALAKQRAERRAEGLLRARQLREARALLDRVESVVTDPLPDTFAEGIASNTLRDIVIKALLALIAITLVPALVRVLFFFVLAPLATRRPAITLGLGAPEAALEPGAPSTTSVAIRLAPGEELLVRQDYLQSTPVGGTKRTRWLLDWRHPLTSLASGMNFLTSIRGAGETVSVSAVRDPFAEVAVLTIPEGGCCVLHPRALAAAVQRIDRPLRVTSHWRLFSLHAWLTWQLRYLVFHGPARLVIKGGRGVRIEPAETGRILAQAQLAGFSTDLAYAVTRTETFWPYFVGREPLLKDRVAGGRGIVIIEEAPLAGRKGGVRAGLENAFDAVLKAFGV